MTSYKMMYCNIEKKNKAHKVYWQAELQGLKVKYFARFLCGTCQWGTINAATKQGIFH
jgi:hypothetical protein